MAGAGSILAETGRSDDSVRRDAKCHLADPNLASAENPSASMSRLKLATMEPLCKNIQMVFVSEHPDEMWVLCGDEQEHDMNYWDVYTTYSAKQGQVSWVCPWWGHWEFPGTHRTLKWQQIPGEAMNHRTYHVLLFRYRCKQLRS